MELCFRPLTGTLLSKLDRLSFTKIEDSFRPLTGTLLSKRVKPKEFKKFIEVSVPSRGLSYLNIKGVLKMMKREFPSPHGDSLI